MKLYINSFLFLINTFICQFSHLFDSFNGWMNAWVDGWMDGWMRVSGWMDMD